jgi:predicted nuclease of restriction endonuclease-like (RecB) superfamily
VGRSDGRRETKSGGHEARKTAIGAKKGPRRQSGSGLSVQGSDYQDTQKVWRVGQRVRQDILGEERAEYGAGTVFADERIVYTLCSELSWSHLRLISVMDDAPKRDFYIELARLERWSVRQLQERIQSMLFERTAISKRPEETIHHELQTLRDQGKPSPELLLKDPYLLDFLGFNDRYLEKDLEDAILREMEQFLLELGAGFTFVARQKRLQIDDDDFYIDLLFYNRKLKRLVAVDLKLGKFKAEYKGQMELCLRWLTKYEQELSENAPLGIILCAGKKEEQIELLELDHGSIHVAEYLTVLPPRATLEAKLKQSIQNARSRLLRGESR